MAEDKKILDILGHYGISYKDASDGGNVDEIKVSDYLDYFDGILRGHNKEIYAKITQGFMENDRILIEQATGTGKSFLAMKLILDTILQEEDNKVLFVSPTNVIDEAFKGNCERYLQTTQNDASIDTCLYQGLDKEVDNHYDVIILDEVHHVGAEKWGASVQELLENNPNAKVLGMSATMDRADGVDIADMLGGNAPVVSSLTLPMAINQGILPTPTYILAKVKFEDDKLKLNKAEDDLLEKSRTANK